MIALSTGFLLSRLSAIAAVLYGYTAVRVLAINPKGSANIVAFFYNVVFTIWAIGAVFWYDAPTKSQAFALYQAFFWCWCVFPPLTLHFFMEIGFPYSKSYAKLRTPLLLLLYIPALYFTFFSRDAILGDPVFQGGYWMVGIKPGLPYMLFSYHYIIYILAGCFLLFFRYLKSKNPLERSAYVIFLCTAFLPLAFSVVTDFLFILFKIDFPNLAILWILILSLGFYYAISKYGFMSRFPLRKNLLNAVSDYVLVCDTQLHTLWANDQMLKATNFRNMVLMQGDAFDSILHNADKEVIRAVALGKEESAQTRAYLGVQKIPVELRISSLRNFQQPSGALIVATDISNIQAREKAEQNAQIQRLVLEHFITFSMDGILLADADGIIIYWNVALEIITGLNSKLTIGKKLWDILSQLVPRSERNASDPLRIKKQFVSILLGEARAQNNFEEQEIERQDGIHRVLQTTSFSIPVPGTQYFGSIIRDITREKVANENFFEQLQKMYALKNVEAISTLSRGLAHDFNNNLTGISLAIALIQDKLKSCSSINCEELHQELHILSLASQRSLALTRKLSSFTKKEEDFKLFAIASAVKNTVDFARLNIGQSIVIDYSSSVDDTVLIFGDQHQLEQAMLNMISNAEQAIEAEFQKSGKKGKITVSAELEQHSKFAPYSYNASKPAYVKICIADEGIGMPEENLKMIFEPFFSTKDPEGNSGLGLTMAYSIVKQHDGDIEVQSKPGAGTVFSIFLPAHVNREENTDKPKTGRGYIYIIDHESNTTQRLENLLVYLNYSSVLASSISQIEETMNIFSPVDAFVINPILFSDVSSEEMGKLEKLAGKTPILFLGKPGNSSRFASWIEDKNRITKVISYSFGITELGKELFEAQWEITHHEE